MSPTVAHSACRLARSLDRSRSLRPALEAPRPAARHRACNCSSGPSFLLYCTFVSFLHQGVIAASARKSSYSLFSMSLEPYSDALHIVMSDVDIYLTTQRKIRIHSSLLAACSKFFARSLDPSWVKQHGSSSRPSDEGFAYRLDLKKNPSEDFLIRQVGLYFILARSIAKAVSRIPQPTQILPSPTFKTNVPVTKPIIEPSKTSSMFSATAGQSWEIFRIFCR